MSTADLTWGLMMMVVGMGAVFALLLILMLVLTAIGRLDARPRRRAAAPPPAAPGTADTSETKASPPSVRILADGLTDEQVAALTVAVLTHAEHRRRQAAPETRAHAPGSQLFASRWLSVGRARQFIPFRRS